MSSWGKMSPAARRTSANPNGSAQQLRPFRRAAPYPSRDERSEELKDVLDSKYPARLDKSGVVKVRISSRTLGSYEELEQMQNFSGGVTYESYKPQANVPSLKPTAKTELCTPADRRKALYQKFYRQVQEERRSADCVILSVTNQCLDYPKSLSQCLQERGLSVEMLYLQADSGLTRALQDVRAGGSPLCILVEQTNIALSSCTVIIFSESLKIHRNMPKDQAMDFVASEYSCRVSKDRVPRDPADIAAQTSQLLDDYLEREKMERHSVPPETRQLLVLLAEGVHLYPEELETICGYVRSRQEHVQAANGGGEKANTLSTVQRKPPPLLPTPPGPPLVDIAGGSLTDNCPPARPPLLPSPGSYPKSKPPSLLSLQRIPSQPPPLGPYSGPHAPRAPLLQNPPLYHTGTRGLHGIRGPSPVTKNSRPPLLAAPGPPPPLRPTGPQY
ncbi:nuclear receptor coactivator 5 isoform X1 [Cynoglossus semilaevis]|uniref:Si:ch211-216l23.2 n=1 Tax=Cynoglossus semilaevis TaxID=244447 RepID=A0A3P8X370_CYNSE|nr:nuclear receptor coactivator 5-like isoform X1 [Cynoglossus semilaevis]XP_024911750.1 nuclear receptor coactivator 5-like isoform X1 [Cynoglossus semilaevis]XP_024911751.1 nuclear receptor coactivator 5-like isoform X1 [Cynoglossus semilaevis]